MPSIIKCITCGFRARSSNVPVFDIVASYIIIFVMEPFCSIKPHSMYHPEETSEWHDSTPIRVVAELTHRPNAYQIVAINDYITHDETTCTNPPCSGNFFLLSMFHFLFNIIFSL